MHSFKNVNLVIKHVVVLRLQTLMQVDLLESI
jgi:hypothetical protein